MEEYKSKSVEELTEVLKTLAKKREKSGGLAAELRDFIRMLKAQIRHTADAHAFCRSGGMQVMLELLKECEASSESRRDLIVVLGTLGNLCAIHHDSRSIVMSDGLERIVGFLKTSTDSNIVSTTARILANLALSKSHIQTLHDYTVVGHLSQLLAQGGMDINCKKNIIRAFRLLCSTPECLEELKQNEGIPVLLEHLKSDQVELAVGTVQAVEVASGESDQDVIQWLCNKDIMQCIIRYCNHSKTKVKKSAVNILLNCAKVSDGRIALSSAGGVETLVAFMESSDKRSTMFSDVVCAACSCCRDVISRQRLRDCGGLQRLITMLAEPNHAALHANIMSALVCYYFDENTLKLMVMKMGLLRVLNYHLQQMTSKSKDADQSSTSDQEDEIASQNTTAPSEVPSDMDQDCIVQNRETESASSPKASSTEMMEVIECNSSSDECPASSSLSDDPPPSKRPCLEVDRDTSATPTSFLDSLLSSPSPYKSSSSSSRTLDSPLVMADVGSTFESQVILMVSRMSHQRDCLVTLSYPDTLLTILNYFAFSRPPNIHIFKVLTRVFTNLHCFQNCITSLTPSKLSEMLRKSDAPLSSALVHTDHKLKFLSMSQGLLDHISKNAQSPYGQGVLAHLLLRGSEKEKRASSLSMPLLCRSPRLCQKLMIDYRAFKVLCDLLNDPEAAELWDMALDSILTLGHNMQQVPRSKRRYSGLAQGMLDIHSRKFPRLDSSFKDLSLTETGENDPREEHQQSYCRYLDTDHHPFDLTMMLHAPSGGLVELPVHRSTLIEESDVFRVMLSGHYKESSCGEVHIHSISPCGFLSVVHHIYGCGWQCKTVLLKIFKEKEVEREKSSIQADILSEATGILLKEITECCSDSEEALKTEHCLQVLVCAGRFLLPELVTLCEHAVVKYILPANIVPMFHFAQLHQCLCLAESCIRALVALPHSQLRTGLLRDLVSSNEGEAALQIIFLFLTAADV